MKQVSASSIRWYLLSPNIEVCIHRTPSVRQNPMMSPSSLLAVRKGASASFVYGKMYDRRQGHWSPHPLQNRDSIVGIFGTIKSPAFAVHFRTAKSPVDGQTNMDTNEPTSVTQKLLLNFWDKFLLWEGKSSIPSIFHSYTKRKMEVKIKWCIFWLLSSLIQTSQKLNLFKHVSSKLHVFIFHNTKLNIAQ